MVSLLIRYANVFKLVGCQALAMTGNSVLFTVAALIGANLVTDSRWATFPLALLHLGTMIVTIPASLAMAKWGRSRGFGGGILVGMAGASLGSYAVVAHSFILFCLAMFLLGAFNAFVGYYRFAAAEVATESFRSVAISLVVAGGVVAAILGPQLATWSRLLLSEAVYAGSLLVIIALQILSLPLLASVQFPDWTLQTHTETGRPLRQIMTQPVFAVAVVGSMVGYGVMVLIMTATPLSMVADHFPFEQAAFVIQWHILGMFAPSFITGSLIARFGVLTIMGVGGVLNLACITINLLGMSLGHYWGALLLLGIGWNFLYVGSTTLLTEAYAPPERLKTQAAHDFLMFSAVTVATLISGSALHMGGWPIVNWLGLPLVVTSLVVTLWLRHHRRHQSLKPSLQG
ncbi:MAG: MFS transporter [Synechococcales cyanobacterium]